MPTASARHILVDSEAQCLELKAQIEGGASFTDVAKAHSSCPSGAQGGDAKGDDDVTDVDYEEVKK